MPSSQELAALRRNVLGSFDSYSRLSELGRMGGHLPEIQQLPRDFTIEDKGAVFLGAMLTEFFNVTADEKVFRTVLTQANAFVGQENRGGGRAWGLVHASLVEIGHERGWIGADTMWDAWTPDQQHEFTEMVKEDLPQKRGGCYVASAVYGSYDCPEVWVLRRFRDQTLMSTVFGKAFVHTYYVLSPWAVRHGGAVLRAVAGPSLHFLVRVLRGRGVLDTPYTDPNNEARAHRK